MRHALSALLAFTVGCGSTAAFAQNGDGKANVPADIEAIFNKPAYDGALWGLRVMDADTGKLLINLHPNHQFYVASVRKNFTVAQLLDQVGPTHTYDTPIYREGAISKGGVLTGNLVLVASGDITMGGRTNPDGTVAYSKFDHGEANSLMNAVLTKPNPLAGYAALAQQVAASGIKEITGEIIIDDRLFAPYEFREDFEAKPIFVNDDFVDLIIQPTKVGELASLNHRPHSAALSVENAVMMTPENPEAEAEIDPALPQCIGIPGCKVTLDGTLPVGFTPPLTGAYPLIRTYRITDPSSYARTILIEELRRAGVKVKAATVEKNPEDLLPAKDCYQPEMQVAKLIGLPVSEDTKLVNKVSYNLGADTSLLLWGLTQGVDNMEATLAIEKKNLQKNYGIAPDEYSFIDGSGGGDSTATPKAVTHLLSDMLTHPTFPAFFATLPILGVDGSLGTVTNFESDPSLAPAKGNVNAKTGTYVGLGKNGPLIKAQEFAGYIHTKSGKTLIFHLVVNNAPFAGIPSVVNIFQDEGYVSAILWRDN
jgi:D-alanyl-D-alanine carboxypeptidase/D-alanyl-D-alanine-endopeptidase (penicillin-binding protein 4)